MKVATTAILVILAPWSSCHSVIGLVPSPSRTYDNSGSITVRESDAITTGGIWTGWQPYSCSENGSYPGSRCTPDIVGETGVLASCDVDGMGNPGVFGGVSVGVYWGLNGQGDLANGTSASLGDTHVVAPKVTWAGPYVGPSQIIVTCAVDFSHATVPLSNTTQLTDQKTLTTFRLPVVINHGFTTGPTSPIRGSINERVSSSFDITAFNVDGSSLRWSVGAPCNLWQPRLTNSVVGGEGIAAGTDATLPIVLGVNSLVAYFTPSSSGEFTCLGTLTITSP